MPQGAVARRNRILKIYGIVLLLGSVSLIVYCATRQSFDLSTPDAALDTFKRAMDEHRWSVAERCLSARAREHYAEMIADRSIFDFYSPHGYVVGDSYTFKPNWEKGEVTVDEGKGTARAQIVSRAFVLGGKQAAFWLHLEKGDDGLWRVDGPRVNLKSYYQRHIPEKAQGWAAGAERK
jgi:hypothetical protein